MAKEKIEECCEGHMRKHGYMALVLGLLVLINAYWSIVDWAGFIGIILVLAGLFKIMKKK